MFDTKEIKPGRWCPTEIFGRAYLYLYGNKWSDSWCVLNAKLFIESNTVINSGWNIYSRW